MKIIILIKIILLLPIFFILTILRGLKIIGKTIGFFLIFLGSEDASEKWEKIKDYCYNAAERILCLFLPIFCLGALILFIFLCYKMITLLIKAEIN